jgi:putative ABC transport system permease protein
MSTRRPQGPRRAHFARWGGTSRRCAGDFDREIESHLELEAQRLIEEGMSPDAARIAARRRFGSVTATRERFYEARRLLWLDRLRQDVRCAVRHIRRYPVAGLVAVSSLAAGIGATTVTLMVRDVLFRKPPPAYADPQQLARIQVGVGNQPIMPIGSPVPVVLSTIWSDTLGSAMAASTALRGARDVRTEDRTETVPVRAASPDLFAVLGVKPVLGYTFSRSDDARSAATPAILSYRLWQRLFDGRPDVIGRVLWIDNRPHSVIGVLPPRFWFSEMSSPIWVPLDRDTLAAADGLEVVVRRPPEQTTAMLEAQLQPGLADYARRLPEGQRTLRLKLSGVQGTPLGNQVAPVLPYVLATSVLLTLLIACANVAILMIAQWTAREHEIAIRASIGASRGRIVRSLLTESVLIASCGGALGVGATCALRALILYRGGADASFFDLTIDPAVFIQVAVITLLTGITAGLAPALYETRRLQTNPLRTIAGSDRVRQRWRHALVVFEMTVTIALLVVTSSMIDGYLRARTAPMGYATRPLMMANVENPKGVSTRRILDVLKRVPGVAEAGASSSAALFPGERRARAAADAMGSNAVQAERSAISPEFFRALGVTLRAGRGFSNQDALAARAVIVNESLAKQVLQGRDPLGAQIWLAADSYDIIGVVSDYATNPVQFWPEPKVFLPLPLESKEISRVQVVIRATGDPSTLVQTVRRELQYASPGNVVVNAFTFDQIMQVAAQEILVGTSPLFPLIAVGMLLTTAGIYGTLAFAITRRSREFAVRVAIGASQRDIVGLVAMHTVRLVATGSMLGIAVTFALARVVRANGGAGSVFDPEVQAFLVPVLIVLTAAACASWIPSRRALRIDPASVLRTT